MRVIYFHQHFTTPNGSGGTRSYEFAKYFASKNIDVTIICGTYVGGNSGLEGEFIKGRREGLVDGFKVIEFYIPYSNKDSFLQRAIKFLLYSIRSTKLVFSIEHDLVYCTSTPLTASIPGLVSKYFRNKQFIFEVRDLWPDLPIAMGIIKNPVIKRLLRYLEVISYQKSDLLIGLSPGIADGIRKKLTVTKPIKMIPNGCDSYIFENAPKNWSHQEISDTDFIAVYTGTHGLANGLDVVIDAAEYLAEHKSENIKIVLVGNGSQKDRLKLMALSKKLTNILFLDPVSKNEVAAILARANIGLQLLSDIKEFYYGTSPNKFFDYIASELPVITNYPGWIADLISKYNMGYTAEANNGISLAQTIIKASLDPKIDTKALNALNLSRNDFDRKTLADSLHQEILKVYEN
tara:strand:+ start:655 stop:1872 length:1218 start_codon:yes stop_codon:yes gene_type:complete